MKRWCLALPACLALALPAVASAHYIPSSSLSCNQLDFTYADFSSSQRETITLTWQVNGTTIKTQDVQTQGASGTISVSPPDLSAYQGDTVSVTGTWTYDSGGSFGTSAVMYCSSPQGPPGTPGAQGPPGPPGASVQGAPGPEGAAGKNASGGSNGKHMKKHHKKPPKKHPKKHHKPKPKKHYPAPPTSGLG